ncbi:MAG: hydroxyphenylacetyl-CoA thioesterase PaaI [Pseudomonadales bacterium]
MTTSDALARRCAGVMWEDDNASKWLGMKIESVSEGHAVLSMQVSAQMVNGHDICHGGFIFSLADSAFAFACNSQNHNAVAASCSIDYIRPALVNDVLTADAKVLHQGGRNGLYDVRVSNQQGDVIAQLRGRSARTKGQLISEEDL